MEVVYLISLIVALFWSGTKRAPVPQEYDTNNNIHIMFVQSAALLRAYVLNIVQSEHKGKDFYTDFHNLTVEVSGDIPIPEFIPKDISINTDTKTDKEPAIGNVAHIQPALESLTISDWHPNIVEFEKVYSDFYMLIIG